MNARLFKMDRYLLRQLGIALAVIVLCLVMVIWLSRSLRFIDYIVNRGVDLGTFAYLTALLLPSLLNLILPLTLFTAVLFVYNRLVQDSELIVGYASGLSPQQLARPVLMLAAVLMLFSYLLTLYLIPASYRQFKDLQLEIRHAFSATLLEEGVFMEINDRLTVYIRDRKPTGELAGIMVYDRTNPEKPVTIIAERGALVDTEAGPRVYVAKGQRQEHDPQTGRIALLYFDEYVLDINQGSEQGAVRWREPRERYLPELLRPLDPARDSRYASELMTEIHVRLLHPLYNIGFGLLAAYFMLFGEFTRRGGGDGARIFAAVMCVILWQALQLSAQNISKNNAHWIPFMYLSFWLPMGSLAWLFLRGISPAHVGRRLLQHVPATGQAA